ncbi:MAG: restriction endonuclease subunit S [Nostoc sp.]|uniref:restriction endonuclease subunit S n=1 Tax=Nostoc sp. TaxID=1180 RepID=UPI002FF71206
MSYDLPSGWTETPFGMINEFEAETINPASFPEETFELWSVPSFSSGKPEVVTGSTIGSTKQLVKPNDVLICKINPRINRVWQVGKDSGLRQIASSEWIVLRSSKLVSGYLRHFFSSPSFRKQICDGVTGVGGSLTRTQPKRVATFLVPVAPLKEQKRIADKLDTLFARLDVCNNRLEQMPLILKHFRQAVLTAATSGQLTEDWREQRGTPMEWETTVLGSTGSVTGGLIKNTKRLAFTLRKPYLRVANVYANRLKLDDVTQIGLTEAEFQKTLLLKGDLLIVEGNGSLDQIGRAAIWNEDISDCVHQNHLIRWRSNGNVLPKFALFWLLSPEGRASLVQLASTTTGLYNLSISKIASIPIEVPPLDEQHEIVHYVENLFAYADRLEVGYQAALGLVKRLTPALLAKAFRGELVPQDPNDKSASLLLEQIRAERAAQLAKPKTQAPRKPTMTKMTKESVREAIRQLPKDKFSFDELRENLTDDYDSLKDILFALLSEADPILRQVFDQEERAMHFFRASK